MSDSTEITLDDLIGHTISAALISENHTFLRLELKKDNVFDYISDFDYYFIGFETMGFKNPRFYPYSIKGSDNLIGAKIIEVKRGLWENESIQKENDAYITIHTKLLDIITSKGKVSIELVLKHDSSLLWSAITISRGDDSAFKLHALGLTDWKELRDF